MEILEIIRDALPEAIGGLIVAAIIALIGYLYTRWRKPVTKPVGSEAGPPPPPKPPVPEIPHNLPQPGEFIGREREKAQVREALASRSYLVCIDGIGGIGKTALALEVVHECLKVSKGELPADGTPTFDTFVWTTAKGRELVLSDILEIVARTLDYPYIARLPLGEKPSETAKLLRAQNCLLIVDNFETITDDAVRDFLLNLPEPSKALITSREQKLRQARAISLRGMEQGEALALIRNEGKRLGLSAVENAEEKALLRLYEATGGAPLAIKWAVGQMKQRGQSLDTVLDYLYEARGDVFENIFARSWSLLSDHAKRVLMVMPIFATSASKEAIEAASDVHKWDMDDALGQLAEMWLVETSEELDEAKRRYNVHPLTRAFAEARLREDAEFERGARPRAASYFLNFANQFPSEDWSSFDIVEVERENILGIVDWCDETGKWALVREFVEAIGYFLGYRGYWHDRIKYGQKAMHACEMLGDHRSMAWHGIWDIGHAYFLLRDAVRAREFFEKGKEICEELGYKRGVAVALRNLGLVAAEIEERYDEAQQLLVNSLETWEEIGDQKWIAITRAHLGIVAQQLGDYGEARRIYSVVLKAFEGLDYEEGIANILYWLGSVTQRQGNYRQAEEFYTKSLDVFERIGKWASLAPRTKWALATVEEHQGNFSVALTLAREANEVFQRLGMRKEIEETRGLVERLESRISEARTDRERGGKFRMIRVTPGFRVHGGSTTDEEN
jgi:tetratricopeptide (TPR) repeat protein